MNAENRETKKKVPKKVGQRSLKKPVIVGGISVAVAISVIVSGITIFMNIDIKGGVFIYGIDCGPVSIDPLGALMPYSHEVIEQVAEGLFDYDYSSGNGEIIYNLATNSSWNDNNTELTCTLRQGVKFHDGTTFNAQAVKWNFDRFDRMYSMFGYPILPLSWLWLLPDGTLILNKTVVVDDYTIKFVLNGPYIPLLGLLSSTPTYIVSPSSTPEDDFIDIADILVGTGPFIYDGYESGVEVSFTPNPIYWGGKPKIDKLIFKIIPNLDDRIAAMLERKISMVYFHWTELNFSIFENFRNTPGITVEETLQYTDMVYMIMNNKLINVTMRKAISYAWPYSRRLEERWYGVGEGGGSPIPKGIPYYNTTGIDVPDYDIQTARQILKDAGWPGTENLTADDNISSGNEWETLVADNTPLATYNHTYVSCVEPCEPFHEVLVENLKQIGVKCEPDVVSPSEWIVTIVFHKDRFGFTVLQWTLDTGGFNDPCYFINQLFSNTSVNNFGQTNDALVQQWMEEAIEEPDPIAREQLYYQIQKRLIEEVFPAVWGQSLKNLDVYVSNLRGWQPNSMKKLFKSVYFA